MWPNKLTARVKVLHIHENIVAHACEACIDADSLRHADGGSCNPLPLHANWLEMALNVADPRRERANGVEVGRERVKGLVWKWL